MLNFTTQKPLMTIYLGTTFVNFFEHPTWGDEAPLVAVSEDGTQDETTNVWDWDTARIYCGIDSTW